ncbi:MAG: hypothetical protein QF921_01265 [Pseudomonadales bacterium]|jgi:hypothetical protein|nr:hypothetical protein [Pseudomonadales bacterium]MDP6472157.1 hypothetical protein [Pseudomonadales bacterium]MDP6826591.1 hypothetical protein [Pseudomonadales bacterium]MDP6970138.1 hypothetical protein [Pseudomonadales bacterium]|tara:strand:- start:987 stop:2072 length:1086 start_codon:yes stop_codon:yes gene_type:complete
MTRKLPATTTSIFILSCLLVAIPANATPTSHDVPDLSGTYDSGTLTPLERPEFLGETRHMYKWIADLFGWAANFVLEWTAQSESDPDREAPPVGGDGSGQGFGAGNVGGYNTFWIDPGANAFEIDGMYRTSIIIDPADGRMPKRTPKGVAKMTDNFSSFSHENTGTAWWLEEGGPGPYDGPEDLALAERCLLGFSAGPPMLPGLYNNFKRIIQTEHHIMILLEMVHDARIIRLDSEHAPQDQRFWLGDSIGWWEDDTLVVDTTNFREDTGLYGGDENLHLVEWFSRLENGDLLYHFTVDDPTAWEAPWSGEYSWRNTDDKVFEYACHEGNYAMGNILRGARLLERETLEGSDEAAGAGAGK